jgi:hypothetical protein
MMDEYFRFCQRNARRLAEQEALEAEQRELEADRQTSTIQRSSEALIYKTYEPSQPQQSATMDAETQAAWDLWVKRHIENALHDHIENYLMELLPEIIALQRKEVEKQLAEQRAAFEKKLAERDDRIAALAVSDAITRSLTIGDRNVLPFDHNRNDGVIRKVCRSDSDLEREAATVVELKRSDVA